MKRCGIFVLVAGLLIIHTGYAQQSTEVSKRGTAAAPFLNIAQGARALSMGGAFVAIANDASSMYWNPAGIADIGGISFIVDHTNWIADIGYDYIGATVDMGNIGAIGVNVTLSDIGNMEVTTIDQQDGTGEIFGVTDLAIGLTYAIKLTNNFSIGFNPKFIYQKIWKMSANAFAVDLGVKYKTPFRGITLGMSISNFGSKMQMTGNNALVLYDADLEASGNNGRIPASLSTEEWDLPLNFRVGIAYDVTFDALGRFTLGVDAAHPSDDYESVNIGGEYVFNDLVYLRGGMKSLFQQDAEESFAAGIGIRQYLVGNLQIGIDYSYLEFARLKNAQKVTVVVTF
jgi:opacity protein-like surface antigen